MALLAFDTATAGCAVCVLLADGRAYEERPAPERLLTQPAHTRELLPAVARVLGEAEIGFGDLTAVAVGVGPGAFTGLRIGVATARAIASALELPLTPVSSLAALAHSAVEGLPAGGDERGVPSAVLAVNDARRQEYFCAAYAPDGTASSADSVCAAAAVIDLAGRLAADAGPDSAPVWAVGDGAATLREQLTAAGAVVPPEGDPRHVISALSVGRLAAAGTPVAVGSVQPNYIREPDAKESSRESWVAAITGAQGRRA